MVSLHSVDARYVWSFDFLKLACDNIGTCYTSQQGCKGQSSLLPPPPLSPPPPSTLSPSPLSPSPFPLQAGTPVKDVKLPDNPAKKTLLLDKHANYIEAFESDKDDYVRTS